MRIAILGASRGLGQALTQAYAEAKGVEVLAISRRTGQESPSIQWVRADFAKEDGQASTLQALSDFRPQKIIYCAGGGPYGPYANRNWPDHAWSYTVTLLFPARLCHWAYTQEEPSRPSQICLIGSSVAEVQADPNAASYASSKHGLLGLWRTLKEESKAIDLRLYSPGYMDTDLIPKGASVRQLPLWDPVQVALDLRSWLASDFPNDHRSLAIHPPHN